MVDEFIFSGMRACTENGVIENACVSVQQGKIKSIEKNSGNKTFSENYLLVPGFIDLHIHGADGCDAMDATAEALQKISYALAREGTTGFLATTMTASTQDIETVLLQVRDAMQKKNFSGAEILGVHLEGPFLSPKKVGAQRADLIREPDVNLISHWQKISNDAIKLVTLAPELKNSEAFIRFLTQQKIIASIGHTDATYAETKHAIAMGCNYATHLFNAMRGIHQRDPGVVGAVLESEKVTAELILDGEHLHPAIVNLALRLKGFEKLVLVTDSMRAKCLPDGEYDLGGQQVLVKNNRACLPDGTLAGSVLKMSDAFKNFITQTDCDVMDALKLVAENPAKKLGVFDRKGGIAVGKDADLVVLDEKLNVVMTMVGGRVVFK